MPAIALAVVAAQPALPQHVRSIDQLVPSGWQVQFRASGTLEDGNHPAVALVLCLKSKASCEDDGGALPRILVVAFGQPDGSYDVVLQNRTLVPQLTAADLHTHGYELGARQKGVQTPGIDIQRGSLHVRLNEAFSAGSTAENDQTFTFRFRAGRFVLVGYDQSLVSFGLQTVTTSINFATNKLSRSAGTNCAGRADVVKHCVNKTSWTDLRPAPARTIEDIGNGLEFDPPNQ